MSNLLLEIIAAVVAFIAMAILGLLYKRALEVDSHKILTAQNNSNSFKTTPPIQISPRAEYFTNRENELNKILKCLRPGVIVTITGPGGIGKTALIAEVLWRLTNGGIKAPEQFPDGVLFWSFYGKPEAERVLEHIARSYGEELKPDTDTAARRALAGKQALMVLDGVEEAEDLEIVLGVLGGNGALVSSRRHEDSVSEFEDIQPLEREDAVHLLEMWGGKQATDKEAAEKICELLGGLPLAIRLAGRYMAQRDVTAREYLAWLEKSPMEALDMGTQQHESVPILLRKSVESLSQEGQETLRVVGILALAPFTKEEMAAALGFELEDTGRWLGELVDYGLLKRMKNGWQASHALIHTFIREEKATLEGALVRLGKFYTELSNEQKERGLEGYERLESAQAHIIAILEQLVENRYSELAGSLAWAIYSYLAVQDHGMDWVLTCKAGLAAARENGDRWKEGAWLTNLGYAYTALGRIEEAIENYQQALTIAREIGDRQFEGSVLGSMGQSYDQLGQMEKAIECIHQALVVAKEIDDRRNVGNYIGNLGSIYYNLGRTEESIENYQQALVIARETGDRRREGSILGGLGMSFNVLGRLDEAIEYHKQALGIAKETGDRRNEGNYLGNLGDIYFSLGQTDEAIEYYQQALTIAQEMGDRRGESTWLGNLGLSYGKLGRTDEAMKYHQQALVIAREIGDRRGESYHLGMLGIVFSTQGNVKEAIEHYQQALVIARETGDRRGEGTWLSNMGQAYGALGQLEEEIEYHRVALVIAKETDDRRLEGSILGSLVEAYWRLGDITKAKEYLEAAFRIFDEIKTPDIEVIKKRLMGLVNN